MFSPNELFSLETGIPHQSWAEPKTPIPTWKEDYCLMTHGYYFSLHCCPASLIKTNKRDGNHGHTCAGAGHPAESVSVQGCRSAEKGRHRKGRVGIVQAVQACPLSRN